MFIDIHSHIINNIDDGAKSEEMTIEMLKMAETSGIKTIVATPHYIRGRFNCKYAEVLERVKEVKKLAKDNNIYIEIVPGQEVYYSARLPYYLETGRIGCINNSDYMLIELPMENFNINEVVNTLYELKIRGIKPIIAHPERCKQFIKKPEDINVLIAEGYYFQLNAGSLTGDFGKDVKKTAEKYIENRIYSFAGSDAHRNKLRNTDVTEFLKLVDRRYLRKIRENSEAMLKNENVEFAGEKLKERRKFLGLF